MNDDSRILSAKHNIFLSNIIYEKFEWLINSYILDFFTESHWEKLPYSWREYLENVNPITLGNFLNSEENCLHLAPLSLLALRVLIRFLEIPRQISSRNLTQHALSNVTCNQQSCNKLEEDKKFTKLFWKHVKIKKQHEVTKLAKFTYENALKANCSYIIDVGSGLGHLCRMLAYCYGLNACGVEEQMDLVEQAKKLDKKLEMTAAKYNNDLLKKNCHPVHINVKISWELDCNEFLKIVKNAFNIQNNDFLCGVIGLHPCGDLGPYLLQLYKLCPNVRFINIVSCCYMKLTTDLLDNCQGYPLSNFCINYKHNLSYHAREVACHAIESYINRLKNGRTWELKIHAYRATVEKLILENCPNLRHMSLGNVKYTPNMTFSEYCTKALKKYDIKLDEKILNSEDMKECLKKWKNVVTFFSIRLMFGPLIESMILLDRFLYIQEEHFCDLHAVFDPTISPRNHVLSGIKL